MNLISPKFCLIPQMLYYFFLWGFLCIVILFDSMSYLFLCEYEYMFLYGGLHTDIKVSLSLWFSGSVYLTFLVFKSRSFTGLQFANESHQTCQQASGMHLYLPPWLWDSKWNHSYCIWILGLKLRPLCFQDTILPIKESYQLFLPHLPNSANRMSGPPFPICYANNTQLCFLCITLDVRVYAIICQAEQKSYRFFIKIMKNNQFCPCLAPPCQLFTRVLLRSYYSHSSHMHFTPKLFRNNNPTLDTQLLKDCPSLSPTHSSASSNIRLNF